MANTIWEIVKIGGYIAGGILLIALSGGPSDGAYTPPRRQGNGPTPRTYRPTGRSRGYGPRTYKGTRSYW